MSKYVHDLWPGSPAPKDSPADKDSPASSRRSSRSWSRSSRAASRSSSRASSRSRSRPRRSRRSRSRSRSRRRHQRRNRRYSRSYSRSRSRSRRPRDRSPRDRGRHGRPRRYELSPSPYGSRSRSRSRGRSHHRRSYYAVTRGRRYYGFGRTVYPEEYSRWRERSRSRSRSRSRTPFRLTEKDRMELLEIAKANAAKALGTTNFDLPASLRPVLKETSSSAKSQLSEKQTEDGTTNPNEKSPQQRNIAFSSNNSIAKPLQKTVRAAAEETSSGSPKIDKKKSPYGLWVPV